LRIRHICSSSKEWGKLAVCLVFPKDQIEAVEAICQFALPSRRDLLSFMASQGDMNNFFEKHFQHRSGRPRIMRHAILAIN
jgi:hypothetical protein